MSFYLPRFVYDASKEEIEITIEAMLKDVAIENQTPVLLLPLCRAYGIITYAVQPSTGAAVTVNDEDEWELCLADLQDIADSLRREADSKPENAHAFHMAANMLLRAFSVLSVAKARVNSVTSLQMQN